MNEKTMTVESILHRKIASILSKGDQGRVMGAYREAVKEYREYNMHRLTKYWLDEAAEIPPGGLEAIKANAERHIKELTQGDFAAMDDTMNFEHKAPTTDARDHSLTEQGSWIKRWLEAK
jgi:hypothetical protein